MIVVNKTKTPLLKKPETNFGLLKSKLNCQIKTKTTLFVFICPLKPKTLSERQSREGGVLRLIPIMVSFKRPTYRNINIF